MSYQFFHYIFYCDCMKLISVIVPVFNAQLYIDGAVNSVMEQTYSNWELILIDDCSTDNSVKICLDKIKKDDRIKLHRMPQNSGPAKVRNVGMDLAEGDFYCFIDADDRVAPNYLECLQQNAERFDADIVWCDFCEVSYNDGIQRLSHRNKTLQSNTILSQQELLQCFYCDQIGLGSMCTKMYRASFIEQNKLRLDEGRVRAEDWEFNLRTFICNPKVVCIPDELYFYERRNAASVIATYREKDFRYMCINNKRLRDLAIEYNITYNEETFLGGFLYNYICQLTSCAHANIDDKDKKLTQLLHDTYVREIVNEGKYCTNLMTLRQKFLFYLIKYRLLSIAKWFCKNV